MVFVRGCFARAGLVELVRKPFGQIGSIGRPSQCDRSRADVGE